MYLANEAATIAFALRDANGNPLTGRALSFPHTRGTLGASFIPSWQDETNGLYRVIVPATALTTAGHAELWIRANTTPITDYAVTIPIASGAEPFPHYVGREAALHFTVLDANANGITNAAFVIDVARRPDGASFASGVVITHRLQGGYVARFTPTFRGTYYLRIKTTNTTPVKTYEQLIDVNAATVALGGDVPALELARVRLDDPANPDAIIRGDTVDWDWAITAGGLPFNLTGSTVFFTAKKVKDNDTTDAAAIIKHYWSGAASSGLTSAAPTTGLLRQTIPASVTTEFNPQSQSPMQWDAQIVLPSGRVRTLRQGQMTVVEEVTRRTTP